MKKRILSTLLAGLLLAPAFVSCINDDSKEFGSVPMAQIQLQSELQEQYDKEKMETLSLTAPDITQAPLQKDVSYTWEIGGKVVSTDKKLDYVCEDSGTFPGRLTIKNADNTVYRQFTVKVHFPYEEGVYALATRDGKTVVTYVSERFKGEKVVYDAFGAENLEVSFPLGKEPTAFYYLNTRRFTEGKVSKEASLFYIATKNPNKFYRVQADSMIVKKSFNEVSYGSPVTAVIDDWKADTEFQHGSGYVLIKQGPRIWAADNSISPGRRLTTSSWSRRHRRCTIATAWSSSTRRKAPSSASTTSASSATTTSWATTTTSVPSHRAPDAGRSSACSRRKTSASASITTSTREPTTR